MSESVRDDLRPAVREVLDSGGFNGASSRYCDEHDGVKAIEAVISPHCAGVPPRRPPAHPYRATSRSIQPIELGGTAKSSVE